MEKKQIIALGVVALAASMGVGAVGHSMLAEPVTVTKEVAVEKIVTKEVPVEVVKEVVKEVPVEKLVTVTVEDESFKVLACDRLLYDDMAKCVQEVKAEDAALKLAIDAIKADFANELEDADIVAKEKYADLVRVYDSYEDVSVEDSDFDDQEYSFVIKAKINDNHEDAKSYVNFTVDVKDGEAEIVDVESI